jgi:hypothetical protein
MKSSTLILATAVLFGISTLVLSFIVNREIDPNYRKDWFAIAFVTPDSETPDFVIANHSPEQSFRYTIESRGKTLIDELITARTGETLTIHPGRTELELTEPYTVSVSPENDARKSQSLTRK